MKELIRKLLNTTLIVSGLSLTTTTLFGQIYAPYVVNPYNTSGVGGALIPTFADLDGDDDLDLFVGSNAGPWGSALIYHENIGTKTNPNFASGIMDPFGFEFIGGFFDPNFVDLDNDGDLDLMCGNQGGQSKYLENTGTLTNPAFATPVTDAFGLYGVGFLSSHTFADMDNDGDQDVLIGEYYGNIYYLSNVGTSSAPVYVTYQNFAFGLSNVGNAPKPSFIDMDKDGDFDVLIGVENGNQYYFQNIGNPTAPTFAPWVLNPFGISATPTIYAAPAFADLDFDGDTDLLCGDNSSQLKYFENITPVPIPPAPINISSAQDVFVCHGTGATLTASGVVTGTLGWYDAPTGGNWLGSGSPFTTTPLTANTIIYVQDSTNGGPSPSRVGIDITVTQPIADQVIVAQNNVFCSSGATLINLASTESNTKYSLVNELNGNLIDGPTTGTGADISFYTGTIDTTTTYQVIAEKSTPYDNQALQFDGTNQHVLAPAAINIANQSFTIEFWAQRTANGNDNYIIGQQGSQTVNDALHIGFRSNNNFTFAFYGNDLDVASSATTDGLLHHWACVYTANQAGTNRFIYLDGVLIASDATNNYTGNGPLHIGTASFSSSYFNGTIDELRIWNTTRTPAEVEQDMLENCLTGSETGLLAYYKMNEMTGTVLHDHTLNGFHGTLMNMNPASAWVSGNPISACMLVCQKELPQTVTVTINHPVTHTENISLCPGENYTYADGTTANAIMTNESHVSTFSGAAANGCDSILTENLVVLPVPLGSVTTTICFEENITINGTVYDAANPIGTEVFPNAGANGCDSVVTINLNVLPALESTLTTAICAEESITVNGTVYNASNSTGTEIFTGVNGCDSTVTINLNVLPALESTLTTTICAEESITINGTVYNASNPTGTEIFTAVNGCDSTVSINLNVLPALTGSYSPIVCIYDSLVINGTTYNITNMFGTEVFTGVNGCDSTVAISLLVPAINTWITTNGTTLTALPGYTYQWIDCSTNQPISGATSQSFTATSNGNYAVVLTQEGCMDTSQCVAVTTVGLNEFSKSSLSLYPNPTENSFTISGLETLSGITAIQILDLNGKQIHLINTTDSVCDVSTLESGMYYLKVVHENGTETIRFVKK